VTLVLASIMRGLLIEPLVSPLQSQSNITPFNGWLGGLAERRGREARETIGDPNIPCGGLLD
jgi:hypothetical protein